MNHVDKLTNSGKYFGRTFILRLFILLQILVVSSLFLSTGSFCQTSSPQPLWSKYDHSDASVSFTGKWKTSKNEKYFKGAQCESTTKDSEVSFTFSGFKVRYFGSKGPDMGEMHVTIDGVPKGTVDCFSKIPMFNTILYESDSLKDGKHLMKVSVKGTRNPAGKGTRISCDAFSSLAVSTFTLTTVSVDNKPLIDSSYFESVGAKCGIEGGNIIRYKKGYRMVTHEITDCDILSGAEQVLALYKSEEGTKWERVATVTPDTGMKRLYARYWPYDAGYGKAKFKPMSQKWCPQLSYNTMEEKWNLFYYANERAIRAISLKAGYDGIEGPYRDAEVMIKLGKPGDPQPSDPWEGNRINSWHHYQVSGDTFYAFYGSPGEKGIRIGLAKSVTGMTGPWTRVSELNPIETGSELQTENPIVQRLEDGNYIALADGGDYGFMKTPRGISAFMSCDGIHWGKVTYTNLWSYPGKWWHTLRTPLCFLLQPDGNYAMYYTAWTKESVLINGANLFNPGKESLGRAMINLSVKAAPRNPVQNLIDNMQKDSDLPASGGNPGAYKPGITFPGTYESVRDACGEYSNLAEILDFVISWTWIWEGKDNQATNTRVACRRARAYWLSKSTGQWNLAFDVRPWGVTWPMTWKDGKNTTPFMDPGKVSGRGVGNQRNETEGIDVMSCKPTFDICYELWGKADIGNTAFRDVKAWYLATDLKLVVDNPNLPDDRDKAKYIVAIGADFGTSQRDKTPNAIKFGVDDKRKNSRNQEDGYPNCIVDGFHGRYRLIGNEWMTVNAISMGPQYQKEYGNRPPPPWGPSWGDPTYRPGKNAWPFASPPYVLTEEEVRLNPPPFSK